MEQYKGKKYLQNVVKCNMLCNMGIGDNQFDILRTVYTHLMPEEKQCLFVMMHGDGWLRQLRLE